MSDADTARQMAELRRVSDRWKTRLASSNGHAPDAPLLEPDWAAILTAPQLIAKVFAEPRWAVPNVIPEGLTLLIGPPKKGKSWMVLGLGVAIANAQGVALGKIAVEHGEALLICMEDSERRLQERLLTVLDGDEAPAGLHLMTRWPRLDEGGDQALARWLKDHPECRFVGLDVLERFRPLGAEYGSLYQRDYAVVAAFKAVADDARVPIVLVHHARKAKADDPLDAVSGTHGLAAAADAVAVLTRQPGRAGAVLHLTGRDVPERDLGLGFEPVRCHWIVEGSAEHFRLPPGRAEIVALLTVQGPLTPVAIAEALGVNRGTVRSLLHRMYHAGQLHEDGGVYRVTLL